MSFIALHIAFLNVWFDNVLIYSTCLLISFTVFLWPDMNITLQWSTGAFSSFGHPYDDLQTWVNGPKHVHHDLVLPCAACPSFPANPELFGKLSCFWHTAICSKGWKQKADRLNPLHEISVINSAKKACRSICRSTCCPLLFRTFLIWQLGLSETCCYMSVYLH